MISMHRDDEFDLYDPGRSSRGDRGPLHLRYARGRPVLPARRQAVAARRRQLHLYAPVGHPAAAGQAAPQPPRRLDGDRRARHLPRPGLPPDHADRPRQQPHAAPRRCEPDRVGQPGGVAPGLFNEQHSVALSGALRAHGVEAGLPAPRSISSFLSAHQRDLSLRRPRRLNSSFQSNKAAGGSVQNDSACPGCAKIRRSTRSETPSRARSRHPTYRVEPTLA